MKITVEENTTKIIFAHFNLDVLLALRKIPKVKHNFEKSSWTFNNVYLKQTLKSLDRLDIEYKLSGNTEILKDDKIDTKGLIFKTNPFLHQVEGVIFGLENEKFILGDDMGLGKSKQIIDLAVNRKKIGDVNGVLIICGVNGLKFNWKKEIEIHSNEKSLILGERINRNGKLVIGEKKQKLEQLRDWDPKTLFLITNIESLREPEILVEIQNLLRQGLINMIAVDEIHKAKNPASQQGKALLKLDCRFKIGMSGTPLMNSPLDLFVILKWLGLQEGRSFYQFKHFYCEFGDFQKIIRYRNLPILRKLYEENSIRRLKNDVLDLPDKLHLEEYVEMNTKQKSLYKDVLKEIMDNIDKVKLKPNPLTELLRLRQVTAAPEIISSTITESTKMDRCVELVDEITAKGHSVIIFSQFSKVADVVAERLKDHEPAIYHGEIKDREAQLKRFQTDDDCRIIIGTTPAMGTGLTLTKASYVIFVDSPWNRANKEQAEDRAYRIGSKSNVTIITLITKDTIDEKIEQLIHDKGKLSDLLIDGKYNNKKQTEEMLNFLLS